MIHKLLNWVMGTSCVIIGIPFQPFGHDAQPRETTKAATKNKQEMQRTQSNLGIMREYVPMDDVGEEVVVLEPVVDSDLLVVNGQRARVDAPLVFLRRVRTELPRKDIQDLLAHPTALKIFRSVACK